MEQPQVPCHQNVALLNSGRSSILAGAGTCLQGGLLYSHVGPPPQGLVSLPMVPALHAQEHRFLSIGFTFPPVYTQTLTQSHTRRGEQGSKSSRTQCQPWNTKGLRRSPVASNGRCAGRWSLEARERRKKKISSTCSNEGVFLLSFFQRHPLCKRNQLKQHLIFILKK